MNRRLAAVIFGVALWLLAGPGWATPTPPPGQWPVSGADGAPPTVSRGFAPPAADWLPGHRGVDLLSTAGAPVRAAASGTVTFAGPLAGRGVIVVDHGAVRTTYEPVTAEVAVGTTVTTGQRIGVLEPGHCPPGDCLHWGLRAGDQYLDPLSMIASTDPPSTSPVRLLPASSVDQVRQRADRRALLAREIPFGSAAIPGAVGSVRPADGPITSPFGIRVHPVTGVRKLHDGIDIGAPCGAAIRSVAAGRVAEIHQHPAYGWWLIIDHGTVGGRHVRTGYAHASAFLVEPGASVAAGQHVGAVGTTGWSTGCHLHFMAWVDGSIVNPRQLVADR